MAAARGRAPAEEVLAARNEATAGRRPGGRREPGRCRGHRQLHRPGGPFGLAAGGARRRHRGGGTVAIHAIDGMAGFGKTAFAVHAAHQFAGSFPDGQFFLPLHAHTPGQRPVDPADALASLLLTVGVAPQHIPPGLEARAARWRDQVAGRDPVAAGRRDRARPGQAAAAGHPRQPGPDHQPPAADRAGGRHGAQPRHPGPRGRRGAAGPAGWPPRPGSRRGRHRRP